MPVDRRATRAGHWYCDMCKGEHPFGESHNQAKSREKPVVVRPEPLWSYYQK